MNYTTSTFRKSKSIALTLTTAAALTFAGCEQQPQPRVDTSRLEEEVSVVQTNAQGQVSTNVTRRSGRYVPIRTGAYSGGSSGNSYSGNSGSSSGIASSPSYSGSESHSSATRSSPAASSASHSSGISHGGFGGTGAGHSSGA